MKLINLDDLVFLGPGSEWFWSAVSAIVVAVTLVAIYRQLRLQRNAAAIEQIESITREWKSERMARAYLDVLLALQSGTKPGDLPASSVDMIGNLWETVGYLARRGHVDRLLVHTHLSIQLERTWIRLQPTVLVYREQDGPSIWTDFEWLHAAMKELDAKRGVTNALDPEAMAVMLPRHIDVVRRTIAAEEVLRTVPVRVLEVSRAGLSH